MSDVRYQQHRHGADNRNQIHLLSHPYPPLANPNIKGARLRTCVTPDSRICRDRKAWLQRTYPMQRGATVNEAVDYSAGCVGKDRTVLLWPKALVTPSRAR